MECHWKCRDTRPAGELRFRRYVCIKCGNKKETVEFQIKSKKESGALIQKIVALFRQISSLSTIQREIMYKLIKSWGGNSNDK